MGALARAVDSVRNTALMVLGITTALAVVTLAHDGRYYDELLWTKTNWHEYVLGFPYQDVVGKLGPSTTAFLGSIVDVDFLKDSSSRSMVDFAVRVEPLAPSLNGISSVTRTALSRLVACDAETALAEILWPVMANWTLAHAAQLEDRQLVSLVNQVCQVDVPVLVLRDKTLALVTVERSKIPTTKDDDGQGGGVKKTAQTTQELVRDTSTYASLMSRRSQHASAGEVKAVVFGCKEVANDRWRQLMLRTQGMYLEVVREVLHGNDGRFDKVDDVAGEDGKDVPIEMDRSCCDYHPQCQMWASQGECKANPKYMVGPKETGQCRLACGVCQPPEMGIIPAQLSASNAQTLEDSFTDTLLFLIEGAEECSEPWEKHVKELKALLQRPDSSHARSIADQIRGAVLLGNDAASGKDLHSGSPRADTDIATGSGDSHAIAVRTGAIGTTATGLDGTGTATPPRVRISTFADAAVKPEHFKGGDLSDDASGRAQPTGARPEDDGTASAIRSRLHDVLHDRCVHVDMGTFWAYQFCYGVSLIQFHEEQDSLLTVQLGRFSETPSSWDVVGEGPEKSIVHDFGTEGAACAETGERRRALVRYLCDPSLSSDVGIRVEVHEPRLCEHELKVYLADLCDLLG